MNLELEATNIQCPYCWETFEILLDYSSLQSDSDVQQYTEDCYVCCRPIVINVKLNDDGQTHVEVEAELR